jgi:hypothetical protein
LEKATPAAVRPHAIATSSRGDATLLLLLPPGEIAALAARIRARRHGSGGSRCLQKCRSSSSKLCKQCIQRCHACYAGAHKDTCTSAATTKEHPLNKTTTMKRSN